MSSIPKLIHYCRFGYLSANELQNRCLKSWEKLLPEYTFQLWNEHNVPTDSDYLLSAIKNKKWANASNYMRARALYEQGGIYLDTDIEMLKSFDHLLNNEMFLGYEDDTYINNAVWGSIAQHAFSKLVMDNIEQDFDGTEEANLSSPQLITRLLQSDRTNKASIHLYPREFFYPIHWDKNIPELFTENTCCIHHWEGSWKEVSKNSFIKRFLRFAGIKPSAVQ